MLPMAIGQPSFLFWFSTALNKNDSHTKPVVSYQDELADLQMVLEMESSQLQQKKGQQERAATSITDQMNLEAQVRTCFLHVKNIILLQNSGMDHHLASVDDYGFLKTDFSSPPYL